MPLHPPHRQASSPRRQLHRSRQRRAPSPTASAGVNLSASRQIRLQRLSHGQDRGSRHGRDGTRQSRRRQVTADRSFIGETSREPEGSVPHGALSHPPEPEPFRQPSPSLSPSCARDCCPHGGRRPRLAPVRRTKARSWRHAGRCPPEFPPPSFSQAPPACEYVPLCSILRVTSQGDT